MSAIRRLPPQVVNQIAAGEVIERPASVVKELLENAVDAGALRIDVTLEQGGSERIRVVDDGCGMSPEDLPLAVASHATSKLRSADDLFRVATMGFRGEALASIASVSQLTIRSRRADSASGAELEVIGGQITQPQPAGCPVGTSIDVRRLFYNTPVRKKFLRTPQTELGHATEALHRVALAWPEVHFTLTHGGRQTLDLPPVADWRQRIEAVVGRELADALIWVESRDGDLRLAGFVAHPDHSRSHNKLQYLFLNGRHVRDRALQHALGEAYRGLLLHGRYPISFLRLEMPPELVDVNVHPSKLEVRFQDSGRVYSQLLGTLRTTFLSSDLTSRIHAPEVDETENRGHDRAAAEQMQRELVAWARGAQGGSEAAAERPTAADEQDSPPTLTLQPLARRWPPAEDRVDPNAVASGFGALPARGDDSTAATVATREAASEAGPSRPTALQIHNKYLVTASADGVVVIDQHALHERILYEQLKRRFDAGSVEVQRLLAPVPVPLAPSEAAAVLEARQTLARVGLLVEPFGQDTIALTGYPAALGRVAPEEVLRQAIAQLAGGGGQLSQRELVDELLHMMACKAAVKAGDPLAPEEVAALLAQRTDYADTHHCPHGRPTALIFTEKELDRRFRRI